MNITVFLENVLALLPRSDIKSALKKCNVKVRNTDYKMASTIYLVVMVYEQKWGEILLQFCAATCAGKYSQQHNRRVYDWNNNEKPSWSGWHQYTMEKNSQSHQCLGRATNNNWFLYEPCSLCLQKVRN